MDTVTSPPNPLSVHREGKNRVGTQYIASLRNTGFRFLFTLWLALTLTFIALRLLPSDAIEAKLRQSAATEQEIARQRARFGLDQPLYQQYFDYWGNLAQGDLGISLVTRERVVDMLAARLTPTLTLAGSALLVASLLGLLLGSLANHHFLGLISRALITLSLAAPVYWTATLAIYTMTHALSLPNKHLLLPVGVLGFSIGGAIARVVENSLREAFQQPYLHTARAKGLGWWGVYRHALRGSLPPILSIIGLQAGFLLSGTVIIEIIFTRRGLGSLLHQAVLNQDYPVVQAVILLSALFYALTRGLVSLLTRWADPRLGQTHV